MKTKNGEIICVSSYDMAGIVDLFINTKCKSLNTPVCFEEEEERFALSSYISKRIAHILAILLWLKMTLRNLILICIRCDLKHSDF